MRYSEPSAAGPSTLYDWLAAREEQADADGGTVIGEGGQVYETQPGRLQTARRGEPLDIRLWDLPAWARPDDVDPTRRRAIVHADGAVEVVEETPAQWLAENGL